eukprot:TRINITY_DN2218_c0_g1_i11.p1 TRINITY_DN2218_c0_g1~~TRINITY_DN2218_c0_g1_i11.p1  ORF type:complete len:170 (-),score=16.13 TRINITY_DN2218_c0_g1_i11:810-1319(-)
MMSYVAQGLTLYASFHVYGEFFRYRSGVYRRASGKKRGAHAMVVIGYGKENGMKYWNIQNSWGAWWGDRGYVKFLRGRNFCRIESGAAMGKAWVKGGKAPPCRDSKYSGYGNRRGRRWIPIPCSQVKRRRMCQRFARVRAACPMTCLGKCPPPGKPPQTPALKQKRKKR